MAETEQHAENMKAMTDLARKCNAFEIDRRESFKSWPFDSKKKCNVNKMAEAGFFWCGTESEADTAECFLCGKVLDGWESTDDPWDEHKRHAPQCLFAKLAKPEQQLTVEEFLSILLAVVQKQLEKTHSENIAKTNKQTEDMKIQIQKFRTSN